MRFPLIKILILGTLISIISSCSITKHLEPNEFLVDKNTIIHNPKALNIDDLDAFIRQKPNRKILKFIPFNLWLYNQIDQKKLAQKKDERNKRYDRINEKRIEKNKIKNEKRLAKGKLPKQPKLKDKDKPTLRESVLEAGEAPVILDTFLMRVTTKQLERYVFSKGFFNSKVRDSVAYNYNTKKSHVYYFISDSKAYYYDSINYKIEDTLLKQFILQDTTHCLLRSGMRYDSDIMQLERERITETQRNNGYFYFAPEYVYFLVDSNSTKNVVELTIGIKQFSEFSEESSDSIILVNHPRLYIGNVYCIPETINESLRNMSFKDTVTYNGVYFIHNNPLLFRLKDLQKHISISSGQLYQQKLAEDTYKRLVDLKVFKSVLLQFNKSTTSSQKLDCFMLCQPLVKQSITIETEGTNTSGNLGLAGSLVYQNKNMFRGAELVELKMKGSLTAQKQFTDKQASTIDEVASTFNTLQLGPELNIYFPKHLFPFTLFKYKNEASPKTYVSASYNYQLRPEFNRTISNISYGIQFKTHNGKLKHTIAPIDVSIVKAKLFGSFKQDLLNLNDFFLLNSFIDHVTTLSRYSVTYNNQSNSKFKNLTYLKVNLSSSGNILRAVHEMSNEPKDSLGRYSIFGTPFSQFVKLDLDYRYYINIYRKSRLVYRLAGGIGQPLKNLNVLPYEQSFFSGGPNSVRAWRARSLGPGGYVSSDNLRFDRIGDIQLEGNIEYRFHIIRSFYGAWFVDAGNIWLLTPSAAKPNGHFDATKFYKEIAMGSGLGIRWDFSFFILRLDGAIRVYDPQYAEQDRWTFNKKPLKTTIVNFGIGYPF